MADDNNDGHDAAAVNENADFGVGGYQPAAPFSAFPFTFQTPTVAAPSINIEPDSDPAEYDSESITSSISDFIEENGRTYHRYSDGHYLYPNDALERDRLDFQHDIYKYLMGGNLHFSPFSEDNPPRNVLDLGTGTGIWPIEMGDLYPTAKIYGIDLSPIQHVEVPKNVHFFIEDMRDPWSFGSLDFVHMRMLLGSWEDFRNQGAQQAFDNLVPGGWFEAQDLDPTIRCRDGTMPNDWPLKLHFEDIKSATAAHGRPLCIVDTYVQHLTDVGFVDVTERIYSVPLNSWARNHYYKVIGKMWQNNFLEGLTAFSLGPLYRIRNLTETQIHVLLMEIRPNLLDQTVHAFQNIHIITARKPFPHEVAQPQAAAQQPPAGQ